jgi:hypothetical protein
VLGHEAIRAMRDLGLFTRTEWKLLEREAWFNRDEQWRENIRKDWTKGGFNLTEEQFIEEAVAESFGQFFAEQARTASAPVWKRKIMGRISKIILAIARSRR